MIENREDPGPDLSGQTTTKSQKEHCVRRWGRWTQECANSRGLTFFTLNMSLPRGCGKQVLHLYMWHHSTMLTLPVTTFSKALWNLKQDRRETKIAYCMTRVPFCRRTRSLYSLACIFTDSQQGEGRLPFAQFDKVECETRVCRYWGESLRGGAGVRFWIIESLLLTQSQQLPRISMWHLSSCCSTRVQLLTVKRLILVPSILLPKLDTIFP